MLLVPERLGALLRAATLLAGHFGPRITARAILRCIRVLAVKITRRMVLAIAAAVPAAGAVGAGGLALRWLDRPVGAGLKVLSDDEYAFAQALAEAWIPRGGEPALSGADADCGRFLDTFMSTMEPVQARLLKVACQALDDWTIVRRGGRFSSLDLETRQEVFRGWVGHPSMSFRGAVTGLVVFLGMGWTTNQEVSRYLAPSFECGWGL